MSASEGVLLIGHGHPRYGEPLADWADRLDGADVAITVADPATWYGEDVLEALAVPRALVIYFGHGEPGAWLGYARLTAAHISTIAADSAHRMVAGLCCEAHKSPHDGSSMLEAFLQSGLSKRTVGPIGSVRHERNRRQLDSILGAFLHARQVGEDGVHAVVTEAYKTGLRVKTRIKNESPVQSQ
jgi:hypothetical protein